MTRLQFFAFATAATVGGLILTAAQAPSVLTQTSPGDWEISGVPGSAAAVRQCVGDLATLAQFEHRGRKCDSKVIRDAGHSIIIQYTCAGADFGRTQIDVLTSRSLRISTQGISDNLPFNYVLQARRIGDCTTSASASRH